MASLFDYRKSQRTAEGLISKFGRLQPVHLTIMDLDRDGYEPGPTTPALFLAKVVFLPLNKGQPHDEATPSDSLADSSTRKVLMAPFLTPIVDGVLGSPIDTPVPKRGDTLEVVATGERWMIQGNTTLAPSADVIVYHSMSVIRG